MFFKIFKANQKTLFFQNSFREKKSVYNLFRKYAQILKRLQASHYFTMKTQNPRFVHSPACIKW